MENINITNIPSDYRGQLDKLISNLDNIPSDIINSFYIKNGIIEIFKNSDTKEGNISDTKDGNFTSKSKVLEYFDKLYALKKEQTTTSKRRNNNGSQVEVPTLEYIAEKDILKIGGYQKFEINKDNIILHSKKYKYTIINDILKNLNCSSMVDIGCSAGILCYLANKLGYTEIYGLDHDQEYINLMLKINDKININSVHPRLFSFGNHIPKSDVVIMCALIHWVYSCTSLYGSFSSIFKYLRESVNEYLIIEWVEPDDGAIQNFKHINFNKDVQIESYCKENFVNALKKYIGEIVNIKYIEGQRYLYIVKKI